MPSCVSICAAPRGRLAPQGRSFHLVARPTSSTRRLGAGLRLGEKIPRYQADRRQFLVFVRQTGQLLERIRLDSQSVIGKGIVKPVGDRPLIFGKTQFEQIVARRVIFQGRLAIRQAGSPAGDVPLSTPRPPSEPSLLSRIVSSGSEYVRRRTPAADRGDNCDCRRTAGFCLPAWQSIRSGIFCEPVMIASPVRGSCMVASHSRRLFAGKRQLLTFARLNEISFRLTFVVRPKQHRRRDENIRKTAEIFPVEHGAVAHSPAAETLIDPSREDHQTQYDEKRRIRQR